MIKDFINNVEVTILFTEQMFDIDDVAGEPIKYKISERAFNLNYDFRQRENQEIGINEVFYSTSMIGGKYTEGKYFVL